MSNAPSPTPKPPPTSTDWIARKVRLVKAATQFRKHFGMGGISPTEAAWRDELSSHGVEVEL